MRNVQRIAQYAKRFLFRVCKFSIAGRHPLRDSNRRRQSRRATVTGIVRNVVWPDGDIRNISCSFVCHDHDPESAWIKLNARTLSAPLPHWITNVEAAWRRREASAFWARNRSVNRLFTGAGAAELGVGQGAGGGRGGRAGTVRCRRARAQPRRHGPASGLAYRFRKFNRKWPLSRRCDSNDEKLSWFTNITISLYVTVSVDSGFQRIFQLFVQGFSAKW